MRYLRYALGMTTALSIVAGFETISPAYAVTAYYQPTPYPPGVTAGRHIWDGWLNNSYYKTFQEDRLQVGGWGDTSRTYLRFDLEGLPKRVTSAILRLMPYPRGDQSRPVAVNLYRPTTNWWSTKLEWDKQPSANLIGPVDAPIAGQRWDIYITNTYNNWQVSPSSNYGLRFDPQGINNQFNVFRSSRYTVNDGHRPLLQLEFTPPVSTPAFKMPLPGNVSWKTTTEIGGYDCIGNSQPASHTGLHYFSVDFSWNNRNTSGQQVYGNPASTNIPVYAAAGGKVAQVGIDRTHPNGYFVVLDHDNDGLVSTGFQTRYLHLKSTPAVAVGATVVQGARLGYLGSSGTNPTPGSNGIYEPHLHFGVRYRDQGYSTVAELTYVTVEGWLLKSIQTECSGSSPIWYYRSTNTSP